jgi:hypothetical protein
MIQYHVRSRFLVDLYGDIKVGKLVLSPYFQRKLVWRPAHKQDFIKTILLGYPFPEIFISRGAIDLDSMSSTSCVVDGQQRMSSIRDFIEGKFEVDGRKYNDLDAVEKEAFLKYEIAIIDLDLKNDDERIRQIFTRLNRTFYALSTIEKIATEYASSEVMLTAKLLCGEYLKPDTHEEIEPGGEPSERDFFSADPNLTPDFVTWARSLKIKPLHDFVLKSPLFTKYEVSRKVHLMYTLNLIATYVSGYYNRNEAVIGLVDDYAQRFPAREDVARRILTASALFNKLKFKAGSPWYSKSNSFSLLCLMGEFPDHFGSLEVKELRDRLEVFIGNLTPEYILAAKEAVNNKRERLIRRNAILSHLFPDLIAPS